MRRYNVGDFINTDKSNSPALIISWDNDNDNDNNDNNNTDIHYLVSIHEYSGDYTWIKDSHINGFADLDIYSQVSILANFGSWFYESHKNLYQELIILSLENRIIKK